MRNDIKNANQITLNMIQKELNASIQKTIFLKMIFPESLRKEDSSGLLNFIFDSDSSYQSSRASFFNGNIYKKGSAYYSRAHQTELNYMIVQFHLFPVFNEMTKLIKKNFILSIEHKVFSLLSIDEEKYPQNLKNIITVYQNSNEPYKLLTLMVLWSIFGEWITQLSLESVQSSTLNQENKYTDNTLKFFNEILKSTNQIKSIDFAFQSGALWMTDAARVNLLIELINKHISINVILASSDPLENVSEDIRYSQSFFNTIHAMWNIFSKKYPDYIKVKVSPIPLMHNYYCCNMNDSSKNKMRLNFYTCHNPYIDQNPVCYYDNASKYYTLFKNEFEYLWSISNDIQKHINDLNNDE